MIDVDKELLAIGAFARLCRLSVNRLRHYDEVGLLSPAWVDPDTGYRYYRPDQAREAAAIGLLRSLDVPLPVIAEVLSGGNLDRILGGVRDALEAELARRRRALHVLEGILAEGMPSADVPIVKIRALDVALLHDSATPESVGDITSACVNRIVDAADSAGVNLSEPIIGLFPLDISDDVSVAVAVETNERIPGTTAAVLPGGTYAKAIHVGPYDQIGLTAHALMAWCAGHGHTLTGPLREVYVSNPGETANVELVTHLLIRLGDPA
jgi:DNA-binding transcriptional MerR regulator/effector-binding domain-containing protein